MNIFSKNTDKNNVNIIFFYKDESLKTDKTDYSYLKEMFSGGVKDLYTVIDNNKNITLLAGLGEKEKLTLEDIRNIGGKIAKTSRDLKGKYKKDGTYGINLENISKKGIKFTKDELAQALTEGIHLSLYTFEKYKSDSKIDNDLDFYIGLDNTDNVITQTLNVTSSIYIARDLSNEPSSVIYPKTLAEAMKKHGEEAGLIVEIYEKEELKKLGLNAMLAVGESSTKSPRLIVMKHLKGKKDDDILGLVGKGITCDTGGYSLKQSDSMHYQKMDMCGASGMFGVMLSLAKNNIPKNVVAIVPSCENIITDISYKIGDVLKTMNGKTVEVLNTDAEGRLALADAITYIIRKENAKKIINMATLTGAVGAMFSNIHTGLITNNDEFYESFLKTTKETGEKVWRLPTDEAYRGMINSDVADIKNTGGCGTITAGLFLREFVEDKPFIHLDIAATSCKNPPSTEYEYKGATGVLIRTIYKFIKDM